MLKTLLTSTAAAFAISLGGCVGTAGISTWEYQSGPGYETERVYDSHIQADSSRGLIQEACTNIARRQADASGRIVGADLTTCHSN